MVYFFIIFFSRNGSILLYKLTKPHKLSFARELAYECSDERHF